MAKTSYKIFDDIVFLGRLIRNTFLISHGLRQDVQLYLILDKKDLTLVFEGNKLRRIYPDEASLEGIQRKIKRNILSENIGEFHPGISLKNLSVREIKQKFGNYTSFSINSIRGKNIMHLKKFKTKNVIFFINMDEKSSTNVQINQRFLKIELITGIINWILDN